MQLDLEIEEIELIANILAEQKYKLVKRIMDKIESQVKGKDAEHGSK